MESDFLSIGAAHSSLASSCTGGDRCNGTHAESSSSGRALLRKDRPWLKWLNLQAIEALESFAAAIHIIKIFKRLDSVFDLVARLSVARLIIALFMLVLFNVLLDLFI